MNGMCRWNERIEESVIGNSIRILRGICGVRRSVGVRTAVDGVSAVVSVR